MKGLWTRERLSFHGRYYALEGRLEPKLLTKPHPPVWIGGWGELTLKRAATLGDNWMPGATADLRLLREGKRQVFENRKVARLTVPYDVLQLTRYLHLA